MTFEDLSEILTSWPLVEPSTSYGTPSFKVKGKLLTRLKEDGDSLLIKGVGPEERDTLCETFPELYYFTELSRLSDGADPPVPCRCRNGDLNARPDLPRLTPQIL